MHDVTQNCSQLNISVHDFKIKTSKLEGMKT